MKFVLTLNTNLDTEKNRRINNLSKKIERHFIDKFYGEDLKELYVGLICVKPQFDFFFEPKRLKYQKGKKVKTKHGISITIEDCIQYELKLNYEDLNKMDEVNIIKTISESLFYSVNCLKDVKKLRDFKFDNFISDLQQVLAVNKQP